MLDPHYLINNLHEIHRALIKRNFNLDIALIQNLETRRKVVQVQTQALQQQSNIQSKAIGKAKSNGEEIQPLLDDVAMLREQLRTSEYELRNIQKELHDIFITIPNIPHSSVPEGKTEDHNQVIKEWGEVPIFNFEPCDHVGLGKSLGLLDFATANKIASSGFVVMYGAIAKLHRVLAQFMLDIHINEHGYQEINVPFIVNAESAFGTGQLPKFKEDLFSIVHGDKFGGLNDVEIDSNISSDTVNNDMFLIPTSEIPVTNIAQDKIFQHHKLPKKYVCHSPCFRSEAGSYGKDNRGLIRQHQFEKVEMVHLVEPQSSYDALETLTSHAEHILQLLGLSYRVVSLCTGDMGFASTKTYDIEVWLPGQGKYVEVSSCSNCESFQARRLKARWRNPNTGKTEFIHTLNGSGLAVGRTLVAVLENYQDEQRRIHIPDILKRYMAGLEIIE